MLPMIKNDASGDHARSYISVPSDRHMCFVRHVSLSSRPSEPNVGWWVSDRTHKITFPSSPADARTSPRGCQVHFRERYCASHWIWLTLGGPANDIYRLCVFRERRYVVDLLLAAILFYLPQL